MNIYHTPKWGGPPKGHPTGVGLAAALPNHDLQIVLMAVAPERRDVQLRDSHGFGLVIELGW